MMKKIISMLLAFVLVFTLGAALVSCSDENADNGNGAGDNNDGGSTDTKDTYTITVKDADGNAVAGVEVAMIKVTATGEMPYPGAKETAADGKVSFEVKAGDWKVAVEDVPAGYVLPENSFAFTNKAVTITLESLPTYTIKVVDQNGDAVVGAGVQMCEKGDSGRCVSYRNPTDENGESSMQIADGSYEAQVTRVPDDYTKPEGYFDFEGSAITGYTVTITVTKNN